MFHPSRPPVPLLDAFVFEMIPEAPLHERKDSFNHFMTSSVLSSSYSIVMGNTTPALCFVALLRASSAGESAVLHATIFSRARAPVLLSKISRRDCATQRCSCQKLISNWEYPHLTAAPSLIPCFCRDTYAAPFEVFESTFNPSSSVRQFPH